MLVLWEILRRWGLKWLQARWLVETTAAAALSFVTIAMLDFIFDRSDLATLTLVEWSAPAVWHCSCSNGVGLYASDSRSADPDDGNGQFDRSSYGESRSLAGFRRVYSISGSWHRGHCPRLAGRHLAAVNCCIMGGSKMSQEYPTLNRVVEQLQDRNLVTDDAAAALASTTFHAEVESVPTPWYVRALVGVSAWVASFFSCSGFWPSPKL